MLAPAHAFARPSTLELHPQARALIDRVRSMVDIPFYLDPWKPEKGPWAEYYRKSYVDDLSPNEKERYDDALHGKNCPAVAGLQTIAFLRAFPFLKLAHKQAWIERAFRENFIYWLPDHRTCKKWHDLEKILRLIKTRKFDLLPFDFSNEANLLEESFRASDWIFGTVDKTLIISNERLLNPYDSFIGPPAKKPELKDRALNSLCYSVRWFVDQAIYQGNAQAIKDVLNLFRRSEEFRFSNEQLYAIHQRAKQMNILAGGGEKRLTSLFFSFRPDVRVKLKAHLEGRDRAEKSKFIKTRQCSPSMLRPRERLNLP